MDWWRNPIKSTIFQTTLRCCTNIELKEAYDYVRDLCPKERGWSTKCDLLIQEMSFRGMSFSV